MSGGTGYASSGVARRARRPRRRATVTGVIGELLITTGVVVLMYVAWQLWIGDWIIGTQTSAEAQELAQEWAAEDPDPIVPEPTQTAEPDAPVEPVLGPKTKDGRVFGIMYIPRFGDDYARKLAGGVTKARTLDKGEIGHYLDTQRVGEVGNFAVAAHRTTYGAPFARIADLRLGDAIVVETKAGWYTYRFRTLEYVVPEQTDVLNPVPQETRTSDDERYITLTSCSPRYSNAERIVAYGVFDSFQPRADGPPASLSGGT
ncbi:MAG: class E sortase [Microbacterium sp.]